MTGQENKRPNELIEHAPVTLRRFRSEDVDALFDAVTESLATDVLPGAVQVVTAPRDGSSQREATFRYVLSH